MQLNILEDEGRKPHGKDVLIQFLGRLVALARVEVNETVAAHFGRLLGRITGIPCELEGRTLEDRRGRLDNWIAEIRRLGLPLGTP